MNPSDEDWALPDALKPWEAKLGALRPRDDRLDRERLIFLAGQASVEDAKQQPRTLLGLKLDQRAWPSAFAAMTVTAATLFVLLITKPAVVEPRPSASLGVEVADGTSFRRPRSVTVHFKTGHSRACSEPAK